MKFVNILLWIIGIILVILVVAGVVFYFMMAAPSEPKVVVENPIQGMSSEQAVLKFNESYIDYLIFAIGGWKLHSPLFSKDTPKIKVVVEDEIYVSEIIGGEIKTEKKQTEEEDMVLRTEKEEIVNMILASDMSGYIRQSVSEGKTSLEAKASRTILFSKGYLNIYKDITGEEFGGE